MCVEAGERRRFYLDSQCSRWKRLYQSCILSGYADCNEQMLKVHGCMVAAEAEPAEGARPTDRAPPVPPRAYGISRPD